MTDLTKHPDWQEWLDIYSLNFLGAESPYKGFDAVAPAIFAAGQASAQKEIERLRARRMKYVKKHPDYNEWVGHFNGDKNSERTIEEVFAAGQESGSYIEHDRSYKHLHTLHENQTEDLTAATARIAELEAAQQSVLDTVIQSQIRLCKDIYSGGFNMHYSEQIKATIKALNSLFGPLSAPPKEGE